MKYSIIIPYRNRQNHLETFLPKLVEHFRPDPDYEIIVCNQNDSKKFRRGNLLNVGAKQANGDVLIFHDVDHVPDETVVYWEPGFDVYYPIGKMKYLGPDGISPRTDIPSGYVGLETDASNHWGGVCSITRTAFEKINGFNWKYKGWGAEETDFYNRSLRENLKIGRGAGLFYALDHKDSCPSLEDEDFQRNIWTAQNWLRFLQYGANNQPETVEEINSPFNDVRWINCTDFDERVGIASSIPLTYFK